VLEEGGRKKCSSRRRWEKKGRKELFGGERRKEMLCMRYKEGRNMSWRYEEGNCGKFKCGIKHFDRG